MNRHSCQRQGIAAPSPFVGGSSPAASALNRARQLLEANPPNRDNLLGEAQRIVAAAHDLIAGR